MLADLKSKLGSVVTDDLRDKVLAWWRGEPVAAADDGGEDAAPEEDLGPPFDPITAHVRIAQAVWGKGYIGPGGEDFVVAWSEQLSLTREKSLAFLGLGLGGPARAISKVHGLWISGFDRHPHMVEMATEQAVMSGMAKKVTATPIDATTLDLPKAKFNAVMAKEEFCHYADKPAVLAAVHGCLRDLGLAIFTDWVVPKKADPAKIAKWFHPVWGEAHLVTATDYRTMIEASGLDLRIAESLAPTYVKFITDAWMSYRPLIDEIRKGPETTAGKAQLLRVLADEAEMWTYRAEALARGELDVYRFLVMRPKG